MLSFLVILPIFCCVQAYNLDTHFPIIYKDPAKTVPQAKSSYFGYSVAMHSQSTENNSKFWIGVGAPRATVFGIKESGALYKCLQDKGCSEVQLGITDKEKLLVTGTHKYVEMNESAWIGVAMATGGTPASEAYTVVCGHRWIDNLIRLDFIPGVCYWKTEGEKTYTKALPLANNDSYVSKDKSSYKWGMGQAGAAVHIQTVEHGVQILIGAPGVDQWYGSVVSYQSYVENSKHKWSTIVGESRRSRLNKFEYLGYAVSSGKLSNKHRVLYAAGGPRGSGMKGHVVIFEFAKKCKTESYDACSLQVVEDKNGETIGEYFGAALAVADINGDKLDDLIVGAPLYSKDYCDQGKVQIFLAAKEPKGSLFNKEIPLIGKSSHGRFGTCVASIGDIDRDGYEDIAIGAPYENEQGAIYIYYGSRANGFREDRRIAAEELNHIIKPNPSLKGFGISIAKPEDIDGNGFKDITVGSFISGHAVILRSYKVINITAKITPAVDILKTSETQFKVTACVYYSGMYAPASVVVNRTVVVDRMHKRFYMPNNKAVYSRLVNIAGAHRPLCEIITLFSKNMRRVEKHDEIIIELDVEMKDVRENPGKFFCRDCAVLNKFESTMKAKAVVNFFLDCGLDNKCQSELEASYRLEGLKENQTFLLGSEENPVLSIDVRNAGDPSYNTEVKVVIPSPLKWAIKPENCQTERSVRHLICEVGNPLTTAKPALIEIPLDMSEVEWRPEPLVFNFSLLYSNRSINLNTGQEKQHLELHVKNDACIELIGKSEERHNPNSTSDYIDFEHKYEIYKYGESPVQDIDVHLSIPFSWKEANGNKINFLTIEGGMITPQCYLNGKPLIQSEETDEQIEEDYDTDIATTRLERDVTGSEDPYTSLYANRTLILSCSNPNVTCNTVHCKISAFPRGRQDAAKIYLQMKLFIDQLGAVMDKKDIISIATNGAVRYKKQNQITCDHPVTVQSVFPLSIKKAELATWIICLSIIAGVLIFMLLVIGLIKAGFFRRKKKEQLLEKKRASMPVFIGGGVQYTEDAEFMEVEGEEQQQLSST